MSGAGTFETRLLTERDVGDAMRLKTAVRWNQTEEDWHRLIKLEPRGCFAGCVGGRVVATTTTTTYGRALAWIGMVLVDPGFRSKGIATGLVRTGLEYLGAAGVGTVKLDATPDGAPVYEALGFAAELGIERWLGKSTPGAEVEHAGPALDPSQLYEFDRRAFGADRSRLLRRLLDEACIPPSVILDADGRLRGYALARRGVLAYYVGPLVATDADVAAALLDGALGRLAGRQIYVDLNTTFAGGARALTQRGFVKQRELVRMRLGQKSTAGTSGSIFAIAGPEVG